MILKSLATSVALLAMTSTVALACGVGDMAHDVANCGLENYQYHGTDVRPRKVQVTACLSGQELQHITLPDGSYAWDLELLAGSHRMKARTIYNKQCATQYVDAGVRIIVEVTCDLNGDGIIDPYIVGTNPARNGMHETMHVLVR